MHTWTDIAGIRDHTCATKPCLAETAKWATSALPPRDAVVLLPCTLGNTQLHPAGVTGCRFNTSCTVTLLISPVKAVAGSR